MPKTQNNPTKSTQSTLMVSEIKDGVVVLRDGSLRAVILASAINFDLMSRAEQDAVEYSFQGFLNSLHFPIQIVIRSQKMDLDNYIEKLQGLKAKQENDLLGILMEDYIENIQSLIEEVNIMDKQFYVVVPYFPTIASKANLVTSLTSIFKSNPVITVGEADFQQYKHELAQRVQLVSGGLNQMGVRAIPLNTQELVDLYYSFYNPDVAANQKLIEATQFQTAAVTRRGENPAAPGLAPGAIPQSVGPPPVATPAQPAQVQPTPPPVTPPASLPQPENGPKTPPTIPTPEEPAPQPQPVPAPPSPTAPPPVQTPPTGQVESGVPPTLETAVQEVAEAEAASPNPPSTVPAQPPAEPLQPGQETSVQSPKPPPEVKP